MGLGVTVNSRTAVSGRGVPTDTGRAFLIGPASAGPAVPTEVRSIADFEASFSARSGVTVPTWDWLDVFFREGGRIATVVRVTGTEDQDDALAKLPDELGPGQVAMAVPDSDSVVYGALIDHAAAFDRFALLDVELATDTVAELATAGGLVPGGTEDGALFAPWVEVPPPAGVSGGTARQVPASAVVAALCARADAGGNPNRAPAGRDYPLQYATGFVGDDLVMTDRTTLLSAGVNTFADRYGVLQLYGFQTKIAQSVDTPFWQANCSRARMWLKAEAKKVGENYMFKPIDARGILAGGLKTDLDAICLGLWANNGLYGDTPADAFFTNVGVSVN
jgi:hypothetical protein